MKFKSALPKRRALLANPFFVFVTVFGLNFCLLQSTAVGGDMFNVERSTVLPLSGMSISAPVMIRIPGKNYEIGKYDVTQAEWRAVMGSNPSFFSQCGDSCPVENVSWNDVQLFIQKLNSATGKQYRLPSEAEWEYACYGGSQTKYCGSDDLNSVAWYNENSTSTHPVGQKQANGYGLYDMSGNVWEWMSDYYNGNCETRVLRGGSWSFGPNFLRAAYRSIGVPLNRNNNFGFRVARTLQ